MSDKKTMGYSEGEVSSYLSQFCTIGSETNWKTDKKFGTITVESGSLGIKRLGMVDYLANHCDPKYMVFFVKKMAKEKKGRGRRHDTI